MAKQMKACKTAALVDSRQKEVILTFFSERKITSLSFQVVLKMACKLNHLLFLKNRFSAFNWENKMCKYVVCIYTLPGEKCDQTPM